MKKNRLEFLLSHYKVLNYQYSAQIPMIFLFFDSLSEESFPELVDKTYNGVIFFLSFSIKEANDIEKSLGKMVMSLLGRVQIGHSS